MLTNEGVGFHPDYGDAIAIERTVNWNSSTYQLKSIRYNKGGRHHEQVVSHKKADLDKLLARFSIQLDNPVFWMSQNRCREFLHELQPNKLYKMFMLATGLDFSKNCYDESDTNTEAAEQLVLSAREACQAKKKFVYFF
ncbi:unnamed protein product [Gongylonema pulchrum]|uniref:FERM domain-containing protein n=1 Tax=Gongylonema pulchrum TaxID=637853 RepID=A0A183ESM4_9BILA|nr:unnamed protein product [Gongylonema pulchrum]